jgi:CubicO group peptidase (beta-lactamase class C family)
LEKLEPIERRLELDVESGHIPGAAINLGRHDHVLFERYFGFCNAATGDALRPDSVWRIFSMTKPTVTVAAIVLAENGSLRLDQEVAEFVPSFAYLRVASGQQTTPARVRPTIQDLMRHTAGLAYGYLGNSRAERAYAAEAF